MAVKHFCGGEQRVLDGKGKCPACGTVCKEWTAAEMAKMIADFEAKGGVWGPNPKEPPTQ